MRTYNPVIRMDGNNPRYEFTIETESKIEFRIELYAKSGQKEFLINQSGTIKHEGFLHTLLQRGDF